MTRALFKPDAKLDALFERLEAVRVANGLTAFWNVDGADDVFARHTFPGASAVAFECDAFFGRRTGTFTAAIVGNRWLDLWIAADAALKDSGDCHHVFIEGFKRTGNWFVLHIEAGS